MRLAAPTQRKLTPSKKFVWTLLAPIIITTGRSINLLEADIQLHSYTVLHGLSSHFERATDFSSDRIVIHMMTIRAVEGKDYAWYIPT